MNKKFIFEDIIFESLKELTDTWNDNVDPEYRIPYYETVHRTEVHGIMINNEMDYINAYQLGNIEIFNS